MRGPDDQPDRGLTLHIFPSAMLLWFSEKVKFGLFI